jgi:DNA-binding ferritin-like protein
MHENRNYKELGVFLGVLMATKIIQHSHHWQVKGKNSYGDHILLERIYKKTEEQIDVVAEKLVGHAGDTETNYFIQLEHIKQFFVKVNQNMSIIEESLVAEVLLELIGTEVMARLKEQNLLTDGLEQAIGTILDEHETFVYLLKQRLE